MRTKRTALVLLTVFALCFLTHGYVFAREQATQVTDTTSLSTEQRIMGLMTVWSEAKYNFPWFDQLPDLNWDATVEAYLPRAIAATDTVEYYRLLMEFAVLLKDGHTAVRPPWFPFLPTEDTLPLEVKIIEDKVIIVAVADTEEIKKQKVYPGLEIVTVDKGMPIKTYFQDKVYRYYTAGSEHGNQVWGVFLFFGAKNSILDLKVKEMDGRLRTVSLTRNLFSSRIPFAPQYMRWNVIERNLEVRNMAKGILYVRIPSFGIQGIEDEFITMIDGLDLGATKGMVIDLRYNSGGNSAIAEKIIACLIDKKVSLPIMKYPQYIGAYRAWGKKTQLLESKASTVPRQGKRYLGPIVVLTGIATASTAEDFAIGLKFAGRALLVGERTAGSAGNTLSFPLPGGGNFEVSTFRAYLPDGSEYVHIGVMPDVEVKTTQRDIYKGLEPILAKGLEIIKKWPKKS